MNFGAQGALFMGYYCFRGPQMGKCDLMCRVALPPHYGFVGRLKLFETFRRGVKCELVAFSVSSGHRV